jgi:hypothetical protein
MRALRARGWGVTRADLRMDHRLEDRDEVLDDSAVDL